MTYKMTKNKILKVRMMMMDLVIFKTIQISMKKTTRKNNNKKMKKKDKVLSKNLWG